MQGSARGDLKISKSWENLIETHFRRCNNVQRHTRFSKTCRMSSSHTPSWGVSGATNANRINTNRNALQVATDRENLNVFLYERCFLRGQRPPGTKRNNTLEIISLLKAGVTDWRGFLGLQGKSRATWIGLEGSWGGVEDKKPKVIH